MNAPTTSPRRSMRRHFVLLACVLLPGARPVAAQAAPSDSAAAAAVVERFHHALAAGDSAGALALLGEDAVILESGDVESRSEYRARHLPADIAFARAVKGARALTRVTVRGDVAWVTSTSTNRGRFHGKEVSAAGAELMVLARSAEGWKIRAVHWSSRARK